MNRHFPISYRPVVLTALALLCGSLAALPAGAQTAAPATDKPVTLNLENVPVQTALRSLFRSAGISNYALDTPAQGFVNMQVSDVPFSVALRQLLRSAQPALDFTLDNGAYHITSKAAAAAAVDTASAQSVRVYGAETGGNGGSTSDQTRRFYPIHINKYDAFVIAQLLGGTGIVDVPPNITRSSNGGQQNGFGGGQQNGFGGQQNGFGGGQQNGFGGGGGGRRRGGGGGGFGGGYGG